MPRPTPHYGRTSQSRSAFMSTMRSSFGTDMVRVLRNPGTDDEESFEVEAHIQGKTGSFDVDTPIFAGDYVEVPDPRLGTDGVERRLVATATVQRSGPPDMHRVKVEWGEASPPRTAAVRRLTFENLHLMVRSAAGDLFADGHYESAVSEAFKSLEVRVRTITGIQKQGVALMGDAFRIAGLVLDVAGHEGRSGEDEREGFLHIFRGSMLGIRNPGAHELFKPGDPQQALEYLGFASLLHRRIDAAEAKMSGDD
jgi:uncharacterized protein (TIGR02391 family)